MKPGLYEKLITLGVAEQLKALALKTERDAAGEVAPQVLSRHLFEALIKALRNVPLEERAARQRELANKVVALLGTEVPAAGIDRHDEVADPIELLLALRDPNEARLGTGAIERPKLPLWQAICSLTVRVTCRWTRDLKRAGVPHRYGRIVSLCQRVFAWGAVQD